MDFYQLLKSSDIPYLVEEHLSKGDPLKSLMYIPSEKEPPIPKMSDIDFFKKQVHHRSEKQRFD